MVDQGKTADSAAVVTWAAYFVSHIKGANDFLQFIALLSINLGVLNLLPIPALDGGRIFFLLIEKLLGRKISVEKERLIHYLGFSFLLFLIVLITIHDLKRIFNF